MSTSLEKANSDESPEQLSEPGHLDIPDPDAGLSEAERAAHVQFRTSS